MPCKCRTFDLSCFFFTPKDGLIRRFLLGNGVSEATVWVVWLEGQAKTPSWKSIRCLTRCCHHGDFHVHYLVPMRPEELNKAVVITAWWFYQCRNAENFRSSASVCCTKWWTALLDDLRWPHSTIAVALSNPCACYSISGITIGCYPIGRLGARTLVPLKTLLLMNTRR